MRAANELLTEGIDQDTNQAIECRAFDVDAGQNRPFFFDVLGHFLARLRSRVRFVAATAAGRLLLADRWDGLIAKAIAHQRVLQLNFLADVMMMVVVGCDFERHGTVLVQVLNVGDRLRTFDCRRQFIGIDVEARRPAFHPVFDDRRARYQDGKRRMR